MTKEQYEKLKEFIEACIEAQRGGWRFNAKVQCEKELDKLMGFE